VSKWSAEIRANIKAPNYVNNFFGMGNESVYNREIEDDPSVSVGESIDYYRYRFEELRLEGLLFRNIGRGFIKLGPALQRIEMEEPEEGTDRYLDVYAATLDYNLFTEYTSYAGTLWETGIDTRDDQKLTRRGVLWSVSGRNMQGLNHSAPSFSSYESFLSLYHSFTTASRFVFALRVGGGINTGPYKFYQAQILDGKTELRGFRKTRFYGDSKLYSNLEVRLRLRNVRTYLFPASFGILGFHDMGRVWYKDENGVDPSAADGKSNVWHRGWGGGLWFTPFNMTVLSTELGHSREGNMVYIRLGFLF
jgi:hypothetical protein